MKDEPERVSHWVNIPGLPKEQKGCPLLLHELGVLRIDVPACNLLQFFQQYSFLQELFRSCERLEFLKRRMMRFALLLDRAILVHHFCGEPHGR